MALAREFRLRRRQDFQAVKEKGALIQGPFFSLIYLSPAKQTQIGFIVSRKISLRAVDRNRIRRRLAEAIRSHLNSLKPAKIIILAKKNAQEANFAEIERSLAKMLRQGKLIG